MGARFTSCADNMEVRRNEQAELTGPLDKRRVQDVPWLLLFITFWVGMFIIGGWSYKYGDPLRLLYGMDSFGNICGQVGCLNGGYERVSVVIRVRLVTF